MPQKQDETESAQEQRMMIGGERIIPYDLPKSPELRRKIRMGMLYAIIDEELEAQRNRQSPQAKGEKGKAKP